MPPIRAALLGVRMVFQSHRFIAAFGNDRYLLDELCKQTEGGKPIDIDSFGGKGARVPLLSTPQAGRAGAILAGGRSQTP